MVPFCSLYVRLEQWLWNPYQLRHLLLAVIPGETNAWFSYDQAATMKRTCIQVQGPIFLFNSIRTVFFFFMHDIKQNELYDPSAIRLQEKNIIRFFFSARLPPATQSAVEWWQKRYGPIGASINQKMLDFAFFGIATLTGSILRLIFLLHFLCSDMWKRFSAKRSSHDNTQYSIEPSKKAADMILYVQDKLYSWYKGDLDTTLNGSKEITVWKLKRPSQNSKAKICPQDYGFYL